MRWIGELNIQQNIRPLSTTRLYYLKKTRTIAGFSNNAVTHINVEYGDLERVYYRKQKEKVQTLGWCDTTDVIVRQISGYGIAWWS